MNFIRYFHDLIWGIPLISLIIIVGVVLTIKLKGLQVTKLKKALSFTLKEEKGVKGEVSTFQALCISLSATIGTGNITGVSVAITLGGPGALFWMVVTAIFGMATKYTEGFLSVKYRQIKDDKIIGGPYAYIEYGMGKRWIVLAKTFAIFGMLASILGMGTLIQINGITDSFKNVFDKDSMYILKIGKIDISICSIIIGSIITIFSALVLIGGVKRIGKVCELLVPIMAITYILICLILIINNISDVPYALKMVFIMAFNPRSIVGGVTGFTVSDAIKQGVSKGIFTNEAGLGSAPIATSTVKSNDPVRQGLVSMTSTFLGTLIICTLTGLCVVITRGYEQNLNGIYIAEYTFNNGLPFPSIVSSILILICIISFAFTTIIGWNLYGIRCLNYLVGSNKYEKLYNWIYIIIIFIGAYLEIELIWNITEILTALMAIPNLIALLYLSNQVKIDTSNYFKKEKP